MTGLAIATLGEAPGPAAPVGLSNPEKAAVILAILGPRGAADLLGGMEHAQVRRFAKTVAELGEIEPETINSVVEEFLQKLNREEAIVGGRDETRRFLAAFLEAPRVEAIMQDIDSSPSAVWRAFNALEEEHIIDWLMSEHPQVAAIALTKLASAKSARILEKLDRAFAEEIVLRMGKATAAPASVVDRICQVISAEVLPIARLRAEADNPAELIATVMNHVSSETRETILSRMEQASPALERDIRRIMFTYEDIPSRIAPRDVGLIIKSIEEDALMKAIKHGDASVPAVGEFMLGNITQRLAERIRGDINDMPPVSKRVGEAAQADLISVITKLQEAGSLNYVEPEE